MIYKTLGEDCMRTLGEDSCKDSLGEDFGFVRDLQGFTRLWERICETLDSQDFGRGFMRICKDFAQRIWERICATLGEDS